jgi:hypothetical protein
MLHCASYPARSGLLRATTLLVPLLLFASSTSRADPFGWDDAAPVVEFDVPRRVMAHQVLPPCDAPPLPAGKLVRVTVPVSLRLVEGDIGRVREVAIELEASAAGLVVVDFAPRTTLASEQIDKIEVTKTQEQSRSLDASLGGQLPLAAGAGTAQVSPSIAAGDRRKEIETVTSRHLPPLKPLYVSGTLGEGRGAFFQLRPSTQVTLEGQHLVSATFRVPDNWQGGGIEVRCKAKGTRKVLWKDQPKVWAELQTPVAVQLAPLPAELRSHMVAKPVTAEAKADEPVVTPAVSEVEVPAKEIPKTSGTWVSANNKPAEGP